MKPTWQGVYPAVTTKFTSSGAIDPEGFIKGIRAQIDAGVHGIIVGGSLGESSTITHDERIELLHLAKSVAGNVPVIVNIAEGATKSAIRLSGFAEVNNADGLMVLPPMMYKPTEAETVAYFSTIAQNTDLPIMVYNNPIDYKVEVTIPMLDQLLKFNTIQSIKESTRDVSNVTRMRTAFGDRLKILCGVDTIAMEELLMGADGWVAGLVNAFPKETVAIYNLTKAGKIEEAQKIYSWFMPLLELDIHPQLVQNIKLAEMMVGLGTEHVRLPRKPLEGNERERVIGIVKRGIERRPVL
ncbi:MAG TPA: dihydrodipicolinate synthase family protein [Saprospiraceae bacterium]|nr:dihydrodipicolinate synthase family protein [Saprospiraceae bacterium]